MKPNIVNYLLFVQYRFYIKFQVEELLLLFRQTFVLRLTMKHPHKERQLLPLNRLLQRQLLPQPLLLKRPQWKQHCLLQPPSHSIINLTTRLINHQPQQRQPQRQQWKRQRQTPWEG